MMTTSADRRMLDSFTATVATRLGLRVDPQVAIELLARRALARGLPIARYVSELDQPGELRALASELRVGETYFFRHAEQLDAFVESALPSRLAARAATRRLRVLSAGCSSGEEPYTLAMLLHGRVPADWHVEIYGADIDARALARAAAGRYSRWSMRALPPDIEHRWFEPAADCGAIPAGSAAESQPGPIAASVLAPALRDRVQLIETNLATDTALWQHDWDMVFCRNVLMYFADDQADALIARIAAGLAPGGFLFLGHAEIAWSRDVHRPPPNALGRLETCDSHGTFYYRRPEGAVASAPERVARPERSSRSLALRNAAAAAELAARPPSGRLEDAVASLAVSDRDGRALLLQLALMQLAQSGGGA